MARELVYSHEALEDMESIADFIKKDSPIYAKAVVSKFFEKADILLEFPKLGRVVPELKREDIRELFVYSYRLIYRLEGELITVVSIVHGKRLL